MPSTTSISVKGTLRVGRLTTGRLRPAGVTPIAQMQAAFAQLPAVYQEVLLLQVRWCRSPTEIASELKLTLPHVLTRLRHARLELRGRLGEDTQMDPEV